MQAQALSAAEFWRLVDSLLEPSVLIEAAVLLGCLLLAWAIVRAFRGRENAPANSIWYGQRQIDGVLFPLLALALTFGARLALTGMLPQALLPLALPVLLSLAAIRLTVRVLHAAYPQSNFMRAVERWVSWLAWMAVVLWTIGALPLLLAELDSVQWKIGATRISLRNLLEGLVTAALVLVLALWLSAALEAKLLQGATENLSVRKIAANALRALLLFVGLMVALSAAGVDLTALGVLGGALGVGIGFGLQKLAANYISGFVILAERSMRIGDVVKVDNFEGRITDITTRYTLIRALNGREAIVPNEMLITQRVENNTLADPKLALATTVLVAYGSDLDALFPKLVSDVSAVPRVLSDPAANVQLSLFAADGIELTVGFWIADSHNGTGNVRSDVNLAVLRCLQREGVEIPYPQRVLRRRA